jgi:hypothetical protein
MTVVAGLLGLQVGGSAVGAVVLGALWFAYAARRR